MSPNFVQRGDIAIYEKRKRANLALLNGADLVLELPTPYALSSSGQFSYGAVAILSALGCVNSLCFGGEKDDKPLFLETANCLENIKTSPSLKLYLDQGLSYQNAVMKCLKENYKKESYELLQGANNLLGVDYIRQIKALNSKMDIEIIKREGELHDGNELSLSFQSGSAIRNVIKSSCLENALNFMPKNAKEILENEKPSFIEGLEQVIMFRLKTMETKDFLRCADVSEGLEYRFEKAIRENSSSTDIINFVKSKRYTHSRIRRIVLNSLLDIDKSLAKKHPPYIRILGFNEKGAEIIRLAKKSSNLPISHNLKKLSEVSEDARDLARLEAKATDVFYLCNNAPMPKGIEYKAKPIILK